MKNLFRSKLKFNPASGVDVSQPHDTPGLLVGDPYRHMGLRSRCIRRILYIANRTIPVRGLPTNSPGLQSGVKADTRAQRTPEVGSNVNLSRDVRIDILMHSRTTASPLMPYLSRSRPKFNPASGVDVSQPHDTPGLLVGDPFTGILDAYTDTAVSPFIDEDK